MLEYRRKYTVDSIFIYEVTRIVIVRSGWQSLFYGSINVIFFLPFYSSRASGKPYFLDLKGEFLEDGNGYYVTLLD